MDKEKKEFKKKSNLKLYHFGEAIVASIIQMLGPDEFFKFLEEYSFYPGANSKTNPIIAIRSSRELIGGKSECDTHVSLNSKKGLQFDFEHTIDVALLNTANKKILPIEVKMGTSGAVGDWSSFRRYIEKGAKLRKVKIKGGNEVTYLDGNMSSILARYNSKKEKDYYIVDAIWNEELYQWDYWCLCIREEKRGDFTKRKAKGLNQNVPIVFTFESLISYAKLKNCDDLIYEIVKSSLTDLKEEIDRGLEKFQKFQSNLHEA